MILIITFSLTIPIFPSGGMYTIGNGSLPDRIWHLILPVTVAALGGFLAMTQFLRSGKFDPTPVITHRFPLEGFNDAMGVIKSGEAGKVVFELG